MSARLGRRTRRLAVAAGALAVLAVGGVAFGQTTGDERIYACVNNGDGAMRQVAGASSTCPKGWHKISWSSENAPAAVQKTYVVLESVTLTAQRQNIARAECRPGDVATGASARIGSSNSVFTILQESPYPLESNNFTPVSPPTGWQFIVINNLLIDANFGIYLVCLEAQ